MTNKLQGPPVSELLRQAGVRSVYCHVGLLNVESENSHPSPQSSEQELH